MNNGTKDLPEHKIRLGGFTTTNQADYANRAGTKAHFHFRVFRVFRDQGLLPGKLEKNRTSPKSWYCAFFQSGKIELVENQNDRPQIETKRRLKFLQFLENFSGVYPPGGGAGNG